MACATCAHEIDSSCGRPQRLAMASIAWRCAAITLIANTSTGTDRTSATQNRRDMSASSGFSSPATGITGSSAIPQMGQWPGRGCRISGCMGQV